jgi:flagellar assembly protein FliH
MSLSDVDVDMDTDQFKPMTVSSLESFDAELSNKTDATDPDFNRFKALFAKPEFEPEEAYEFKAMYDPEKEEEEIVFTPLIKQRDESPGKKKSGETKATGKRGGGRELKDLTQGTSPEREMPETPEETPEEKGYQDGFEKGMEQGIEQGQKQGFEQGLKKGEAQGLEKGEQQGFEQGELKGLEQGLKAGEEKANAETREKAAEILASLETTLKTADQTLDLLVEKYEHQIIDLIQQIAGRVIGARIEMDDDLVKGMILDALKTLVHPEEVTLNVSAEDYEYIEMVKDEFFEAIDSLNHVSVRSDPSIKRGGCKIETNTASVSSDPESRLEAIFKAVKAAGNP